ncbi:MAG: hypothetical protein JKY37_09995, partial [Nannocystaceae bacterium]|nr:hypothetical protein [Nannocystaceae bacterium]
MRLPWTLCFPLVIALACDSESSAPMAAEAEDSFQDDDIPPGNGCDGTACPSGEGVGGGEPAEVGGPCDDAGHCQSGVCAASFAQSAPGELLCQESCIGPMDTAMWCSDSAACCSAAVCSARGFCIPQDSDNENSDNDGSDGTGGSDGT